MACSGTFLSPLHAVCVFSLDIKAKVIIILAQWLKSVTGSIAGSDNKVNRKETLILLNNIHNNK